MDVGNWLRTKKGRGGRNPRKGKKAQERGVRVRVGTNSQSTETGGHEKRLEVTCKNMQSKGVVTRPGEETDKRNRGKGGWDVDDKRTQGNVPKSAVKRKRKEKYMKRRMKKTLHDTGGPPADHLEKAHNLQKGGRRVWGPGEGVREEKGVVTSPRKNGKRRDP